MRWRLPIILILWTMTVPLTAGGTDDTANRQDKAVQPVVFLDVQASTWRPRGRISYGITPALRTKLTSAGFLVTQERDQPHEMNVTVQYHEAKGRSVAVNLFGTHITCRIILYQPQRERRLVLNIHESPSYRDLVNAPYVEVVEQLEANPYFYFLGEITRLWIDTSVDRTGALIQALDRQVQRQLHPPEVTPLDTLVSPAETFPDLNVHFAVSAQHNTIDELGRLKDTRAIDLLERLTVHPDSRTRLRAVVALGQFDSGSIVPVMTRVVEKDHNAEVRNAAASVLTKFSRR